MTFPATDSLGNTQQLLTGTELSSLLTAITNAVGSGAATLPTGAATQATLAQLLAAFPGSLGPKTAANSLAVTLSTDGVFSTTTPADDLFAIAPSDSTPLSPIPKALYVTVAGNVAVRGTGNSPVTLAVTAGQVLPIRARYVYATGTSATVVGLV